MREKKFLAAKLIRFSTDEATSFEAEAAAEGVSLTHWIRTACRDAVRKKILLRSRAAAPTESK